MLLLEELALAVIYAERASEAEFWIAMDEFETELSVYDSESGADRESCYDPEASAQKWLYEASLQAA
jgi:hypothetical protein